MVWCGVVTYSAALEISSSFETWGVTRVHLLLGHFLGPWLATRGQYITKTGLSELPDTQMT